jgi:hypothetical protein
MSGPAITFGAVALSGACFRPLASISGLRVFSPLGFWQFGCDGGTWKVQH